MTEVLAVALVPVFLIIGLGYLAGRARVADAENVADLNAFVMQFAVPASLFLGMAGLTRGELIGQASLAGLFLVVMMVVFGVWLAVARRRGASLSDAAVQALTVAFPNLAAVALPLLAGFDPHGGIAKVAVALAVGSVGPTALTLVLIDIDGAGGLDGARLRRAARQALLRPLILAPVLGGVLSLSGATLPLPLAATLKMLSQAAAASALFLTGLVVASQPIRATASTVAATFVMQIVRPLLMLAFVQILHVGSDVGHAAVLMAAVPAGFFGILFGIAKRVPIEQTGSIIILSYLTALVTLTATVALLYG